jgi:predicted ATP-grasp superfamily ATP-dependent carboligase
VTDRRGLITYISPKTARVLGRENDTLRGSPLREIIDTGPNSEETERRLAFHLSARSAFQDLDLRAASHRKARSVGGRSPDDRSMIPTRTSAASAATAPISPNSAAANSRSRASRCLIRSPASPTERR